MRLSYGRRNLQNNINFYRSYYIVFQPNFVSELVMVGKITSNKFLSGSQIAALKGDSKFTTPNTLLTDILAERKVQGFVVTQVEQNEAMVKGGDIGDYIYPSKDPNDLAMGFDSHDSDAPVVNLPNVGGEILEINLLKLVIYSFS